MAAIQSIRTIVGLEIHVQLRTRTKLFCACPVKVDAPPNSCVCEVCLAHPGALPVINRKAVELAVLTGLALNCEIAPHTKWDRKSYFYPDLPKGYQISQYDLPVAANGHFEFEVAGQPRRVRIRRAHLEEDAGKNIHDVGGGTLVDLNRAGTPLLEIVTEPDIASAEEAFVFGSELQRLVRHLGVSEASMQKGHMRFEPNVNLAIQADGREFRTPIAEIKNINSFRFAKQAIEYESQRHLSEWQADRDYVIGKKPNENRGWNAERGITEFQRGKEAAHDYRYFPDPDLVPVEFTRAEVDEIRRGMPELPEARRRRLIEQHKLSAGDVEVLIEDRGNADFFDEVLRHGAAPDVASKQVVNLWLRFAANRGAMLADLGVSAERVAELARMTGDGIVSSSAASQVADAMLSSGESPRAIADRLGVVQVRDTAATQRWVDEAFAQNAQAVQDAMTNPKKAKAAAGFLRGQVMKISGGKADPKLVGELIEKRLNA